jgi:hypothetical protein
MAKARNILRDAELTEIRQIATQAARAALAEDADAIASEIEMLIDDVAEPKIKDIFEQRWATVKDEVDRANNLIDFETVAPQ